MTVFELGTRVPFFIRAPGMHAAGETTQALVEAVDIYPTLIDLAAGVHTTPDYLDGTSLRPLLANPAATVKVAAFSEFVKCYSCCRVPDNHPCDTGTLAQCLCAGIFDHVSTKDRQMKLLLHKGCMNANWMHLRDHVVNSRVGYGCVNVSVSDCFSAFTLELAKTTPKVWLCKCWILMSPWSIWVIAFVQSSFCRVHYHCKRSFEQNLWCIYAYTGGPAGRCVTPGVTNLSDLSEMSTCFAVPREQFDFVGYSVRTNEWRCTCVNVNCVTRFPKPTHRIMRNTEPLYSFWKAPHPTWVRLASSYMLWSVDIFSFFFLLNRKRT